MKIVEVSFPEREVRTANLSLFFSVLSGVSIAVNLLVTPIVLNRLGVLAGLLVQPVLLAASALSLHLLLDLLVHLRTHLWVTIDGGSQPGGELLNDPYFSPNLSRLSEQFLIKAGRHA